MSDRILRLLIGLLILVIVAWLAARSFSGFGGGAEADDLELATDVQAIDSIVVVGPDETVRLRQGETWTVNGYETIPETGPSITRALEDASLGQMISRNPENHQRMGVTDQQGRLLTIFIRDAEPWSIILGERAGAFDEAFARRIGADEVYVLRGSLVSLANRTVDDWRDREIFSAERAAVQRIEFEYPDESFAIARDSTGWRVASTGAEADLSAVSTMLQQLTSLRAIGFAADSVVETLEWDPPQLRLRVVGLADAELAELLFIENEEIGYFVRRADMPIVYTVSSYTGDQIARREADLAVDLAE
jgi:hypothetical protein